MKRKIENNLAQLQNLIKRDPLSYKNEFDTQLRHFDSCFELFKLKPNQENEELQEIVMFISQISLCFKEELKDFPLKIYKVLFLLDHYLVMASVTRMKMVQSLILLRNKQLIPQSECKDKLLRSLLHNHIVSDIKNSNQKSKNNKLNKELQNYMYKMLSDSSPLAAKLSLQVMIELYQKNVWKDQKTVNVIAEACLSDEPKLVAPALYFFLGSDEKEESDDELDVPDLTGLKHANLVNKKKKSRANQLQKAQATVRRKERQRQRPENFNFSALHLINDPQGFSEKLFAKLKKVSNKTVFNFELRLEMMNLISRLVGIHKLIILGFYEFMISYIKPHQKNVAQILAFIAQASHELVPPDALETCIRAIADNFVWSNCASEVITAGLNALREICTRAPLAMPEELLQSLLEDYKNHRDKGPMTAARALLSLFREFNPKMLKKKDRGKAASVSLKNLSVRKYGEVEALDDVQGAELLEEEDDEDIPELVDGDVEEMSLEDGETFEVREIDENYKSSDEEDDAEDEDEEVEFDDGEEYEFDEDADEIEEDEDEEAPETTTESPKKKRKTWGTQKIFTDEDFAKIRERREEQESMRLAGRKLPLQPESSEIVSESNIMAFTRKKDDYAARLEKIKEGRIGRDYGSKRGKDERSSKTNREKAKSTKPMTMLVHKRSVTQKKNRSLIEKQRVLRAHITKQKKKGF